MSEAADERAALADRVVSDVGGHPHHEGRERRRVEASMEVRVSRRCADDEPIALDRQPRKAADRVHVDEGRRASRGESS